MLKHVLSSVSQTHGLDKYTKNTLHEKPISYLNLPAKMLYNDISLHISSMKLPKKRFHEHIAYDVTSILIDSNK